MVAELTFWPIIAVIVFAMWVVAPWYGIAAAVAALTVIARTRKGKK